MKKKLSPESLMMSYGYDPQLSEGALKCPIFQTSTFVFRSAEEGKAYFELAYGKKEITEDQNIGLIYSRINNPDLEILENRLCLWDDADDCAVFESGMSAITTVLLEFLKPGDLLIYSNPLYGGTDHFIHHYLRDIGIHLIPIDVHDTKETVIGKIEKSGYAHKLKMIFAETPANPTNALIDISMCKQIVDMYTTIENHPIVAIDNTFMGPMWQHPLQSGADLVLYSATKYIGGHSDVIAGAVLGKKDLMARIKTLRTFLGNMAGPWTGWLLMRSLETLKIRMEKQQENAIHIAQKLRCHPLIEKVHYLDDFDNPIQKKIFSKQCLGSGAMISFDIKGSESEAFQFLNNLKLFKLAVSLGGTESLAQHPYTMTHAGVDDELKVRHGVTPSLVRLSIGIEKMEDIWWDIEQALNQVDISQSVLLVEAKAELVH